MICKWRSCCLKRSAGCHRVGNVAGSHHGERLSGIGGHSGALVQQRTVEVEDHERHAIALKVSRCRTGLCRSVLSDHKVRYQRVPDRLRHFTAFNRVARMVYAGIQNGAVLQSIDLLRCDFETHEVH